MITFYFENGCVATLRTSGTEPKIKYYTELTGQPGEKYVTLHQCSALSFLISVKEVLSVLMLCVPSNRTVGGHFRIIHTWSM